MESSFAGAPPVEAEQEAPQVQPEAASQPEPTQPAPAEQPQGEQDPVLIAIERMEQRIDERLPQPQQESSPAPDLLEALLGEEQRDDEPAAQLQAPAEQPQGEDYGPQAQAEYEALQQIIRSEAEQIVSPYIQQQNEREIRGLQEKYPDITDRKILEPLEAKVGEFIAQTGDESLKENARFVEGLYKVVKAELADANAVPAESAATNGASLETNGGASQAGSAQPSVEEFYKQNVFQTGGKDPILG